MGHQSKMHLYLPGVELYNLQVAAEVLAGSVIPLVQVCVPCPVLLCLCQYWRSCAAYQSSVSSACQHAATRLHHPTWTPCTLQQHPQGLQLSSLHMQPCRTAPHLLAGGGVQHCMRHGQLVSACHCHCTTWSSQQNVPPAEHLAGPRAVQLSPGWPACLSWLLGTWDHSQRDPRVPATDQAACRCPACLWSTARWASPPGTGPSACVSEASRWSCFSGSCRR